MPAPVAMEREVPYGLAAVGPRTPAGYVMTELGLLPEDWEVVTIGDIMSFEGGGQPPKSVFNNRNALGYIRLIQIRDYKSDDFETYIPIYMARKFCTEADIMIGRYGPPIFQILKGIAGAYNVALIKATPKNSISRLTIYYHLTQKKLFDFVEVLSRRSSGQTGVDINQLRNYQIPLSKSYEERDLIAQALTDADSLIESLDALIAKKENIKQGAMQELLTGKRRLPGFEGEWEVKRLGEIGDIITGSTPSTANPKNWEGYIPWITPTDIDNQKIVYTSERQITDLGLSTIRRVPANSVLVTCIASIGKNAILAYEGACNQQINAISPHANFSSEFIYYLMEVSKSILLANAGITATLIISKSEFATFEFSFPILLEQQAIATILSDMDAELEALQARMGKARAIKEGMMQKLLTGQIRLV